MSWLTFVLLALVLIFAVQGFRKGMLRMAISMVFFLMVLGVTSWLNPYISDFVREKTTWQISIEEKCNEVLLEQLEGSTAGRWVKLVLLGAVFALSLLAMTVGGFIAGVAVALVAGWVSRRSTASRRPTVSLRDADIFWVRSPAAMRLAHSSICDNGATVTWCR